MAQPQLHDIAAAFEKYRHIAFRRHFLLSLLILLTAIAIYFLNLNRPQIFFSQQPAVLQAEEDELDIEEIVERVAALVPAGPQGPRGFTGLVGGDGDDGDDGDDGTNGTGGTGGTGFWQRSGTDLSPATAGDDVLLNANEQIVFESALAGGIIFLDDGTFQTDNDLLLAADLAGSNAIHFVAIDDPTSEYFTVRQSEVVANAGDTLRINSESATGARILFNEGQPNGSEYVGFQAPAAIGANQIWTLPAADGTDGQTLQTDGSGMSISNRESGVVVPRPKRSSVSL